LAAVGVLAVHLLVRPSRPRAVAREVARVLTGVRGETVLFVSAGVLAMGAGQLLATLDVVLPFDAYGVPVAWASAVLMIALAFIGIHPIISIGLIAAIVMPLGPDPSLFVSSAL